MARPLVVKTSAIVFFLLFGAKLLNFAKKILIGKLFGVSWVADAFFAASYLPYMGAIFFEGILFLGFLPFYAQAITEKGEAEANRFAHEVFLGVTTFTGLLVLGSWWFAPWIVEQLVPGFTVSERELTQSLFRILTLVLVFISLCSFYRVLNSYHSNYSFAASSGFVDTLVMIGVLVISWKFWGIHGAVWGAVGGAFVACVSQAMFFYRKRPLSLERWATPTVWCRKLVYLLLPMALIWTLGQIPFIILNRFGSGMWEGTISAISIAYTLTIVPMGLVSHTILISIFPSLAKQAGETRHEDMQETFFSTLRGAFFILIPVGFLFSSFAYPLAVLFFRGGNISEEGTRRIINTLVCIGWSAFALYADLFMTQSLIAVRRTILAIVLCATRALLTYVFCYFLSAMWDYQGLASGFVLALVVNLTILFPLCLRQSPFSGQWKNLFWYSGKLVFASSPALLIGWFTRQWSVEQWTHFSLFIPIGALVVGGLFGLGCFVGILMWLNVREVNTVIQNVVSGWNKKSVPLYGEG